jgi:hypothetical protein
MKDPGLESRSNPEWFKVVAYAYVVALAGMADGEAESGKADCYHTYGDVPEQLGARGTHSVESPQ